MYGTVRPTGRFAHLGALEPSDQAPQLHYKVRAELRGLAAKAAIVSVSVANGVRALAVLVVEDDFFVRCDVAGCLREAGYTVIETESGEAAIALCKLEMTIDMAFTDINLGGTATGWDVAKRFRSEQPDMPVVYLSAQAFDRDRCVPGSVFVAKPYQHIDILSACQRLRK